MIIIKNIPLCTLRLLKEPSPKFQVPKHSPFPSTQLHALGSVKRRTKAYETKVNTSKQIPQTRKIKQHKNIHKKKSKKTINKQQKSHFRFANDHSSKYPTQLHPPAPRSYRAARSVAAPRRPVVGASPACSRTIRTGAAARCSTFSPVQAQHLCHASIFV